MEGEIIQEESGKALRRKGQLRRAKKVKKGKKRRKRRGEKDKGGEGVRKRGREQDGAGRNRRKKAGRGCGFQFLASISGGLVSLREGSRQGTCAAHTGGDVGSTQPQQPDLFIFVQIVVFSLVVSFFSFL